MRNGVVLRMYDYGLILNDIEFMHCTTRVLCSNSSIDTIDGHQDREAERGGDAKKYRDRC